MFGMRVEQFSAGGDPSAPGAERDSLEGSEDAGGSCSDGAGSPRAKRRRRGGGGAQRGQASDGGWEAAELDPGDQTLLQPVIADHERSALDQPQQALAGRSNSVTSLTGAPAASAATGIWQHATWPVVRRAANQYV